LKRPKYFLKHKESISKKDFNVIKIIDLKLNGNISLFVRFSLKPRFWVIFCE